MGDSAVRAAFNVTRDCSVVCPLSSTFSLPCSSFSSFSFIFSISLSTFRALATPILVMSFFPVNSAWIAFSTHTTFLMNLRITKALFFLVRIFCRIKNIFFRNSIFSVMNFFLPIAPRNVLWRMRTLLSIISARIKIT